MIYGSNEKGEGVLTLSSIEHERFKDGKPVVKETGCAKGLYKITVQMERIGDLPESMGGEKKEKCENCGRKKKTFIHTCESTTMLEVYGCPECDDHCGFCE